LAAALSQPAAIPAIAEGEARKEKESIGLLLKAQNLIIVLIMPLLIVAGGIIHYHTIRFSRFQIKIPRRESPLNRLRISMAGDFQPGIGRR